MTASKSLADRSNLYDLDYCFWLEHTAQLLKEGKLSEVDTVNLIEEIEDMGRREKTSINSRVPWRMEHPQGWIGGLLTKNS